MILKIHKLHSPKVLCNFENCQNHLYLLITNCTRGHAISFTYHMDYDDNKYNYILKDYLVSSIVEYFCECRFILVSP